MSQVSLREFSACDTAGMHNKPLLFFFMFEKIESYNF
jgi:hypothetical protein